MVNVSMLLSELKSGKNKFLITRFYVKKFIFQLLFYFYPTQLKLPNIHRRLYLQEDRLSDHTKQLSIVDLALTRACEGVSQLPHRVLKLSGMTGAGFRHFLNNLVALQKNAYLEVGVWKASSAISAGYSNRNKLILIDDWSEFTGPRKIAIRRLRHFLNDFQLIEGDFSVQLIKVQDKVGVYFYDGAHDYDSQLHAVKVIGSLKFDYLVLIVDDYNAPNVVKGTEDGLMELIKSSSVVMIADWVISPDKSDKGFQFGSWHNGYRIILLMKN